MGRVHAAAVLAVVLLSIGVLAGAAKAQSTAAAVSGEITDPNGRVVPSAEVALTNLNTNVAATTKTNGEGIYRISGLLPGIYRVNVTKDGFKSIVKGDIELHVQDNVSINFALEIGSVGETVTVQAGMPTMNTTDGAVGTVVDRQFVENIPLNGRSLQDLMTLAPGVVQVGGTTTQGQSAPGYGGELSVNGQRTEANYFTVDGVSATLGTSPGSFGFGAGYSGSTPAQTVLGTTQSIVSVDALQEFRASTSTYSSEYGRTPGGQFAFTTRSGTNDWHGSAFDYFRNEALDANNWFLDETDQPKEKERQNDFGGTLGGPLVIPGLYDGRDKTFFFFSYEGLRLWTPAGVVSFSVPDPTLRQQAPAAVQPFLNAFPKMNAGEDGLDDGLGVYQTTLSNPSTLDNINVRIDHNFGHGVSVFGRYADSPSNTQGALTTGTETSAINSWSLTLGATAVFTPDQTNELRFNVTHSNSFQNSISTSFGGSTAFDVSALPGPDGKPFPTVGGSIFVCVCFGNGAALDTGQSKNDQRQYNLVDNYTWAAGRHEFKFGVDWRRISTYLVPITLGESAFFFSEQSILDNALDSASVTSQSPAPVEPVYKSFSTYIQDEWKVTPRLSLSLGLRWDVNPPPSNATGPSPYTLDQVTNLATAKLAPEGTPLWHTDWHAFAPRFGLAYQLRGTPDHATVIRAGIGQFYDLGNNSGSEGFHAIGFAGSISYESTPEMPVSFPLTPEQLSVPAPDIAPPYNNAIYAWDPHLQLPYTLEWNVAIQQALSPGSTFTATYVGSAGRDLLKAFEYYPEDLGNPNFSAAACAGCLSLTSNGATSDYDALQLQYQARTSSGLQALVSYTYSHSIDEASTNGSTNQLLRASSSFDIRHNLQGAVTYDIPKLGREGVISSIFAHWGIDARLSARTALPVDILDGQDVNPLTHQQNFYHPNIVPGVPVYLHESWAPGGRILNYDAFSLATDADGNLIDGNTGRNYARGFGAWQLNLAIRRDFPIREKLHLQFRAEAFNLLNHPSFGGLIGYQPAGPCSPPPPGQSPFCFGVADDTLNAEAGSLSSMYSIGGPRSLQMALKLIF